MTIEDLARKVKDMRDAQRKYFKSRTAASLNESCDAERRVDRVIEEILNPPKPELFGEERAG